MPPLLSGKRYPAIVFAVFMLGVGILLPRFWTTFQVNRWSIVYLAQSMNPGRQAQPLPSAPQAHDRAILWLAQVALISGDPLLALDMIQPLLERADPILLSLQGDALIAMNDFEGAVEVWVQVGDFQSLITAADAAASADLLEEAELAYRGAWGLNPLGGTLPLANFLWLFRKDPSAAEHI